MDNSTEMDVLPKAKHYINQLFKKQNSTKLVYHTFNHILETVSICEEMAKNYNLTKGDTELLLLGSFFQHVGYLISYHEPEKESLGVINDFFAEIGYPENQSESVRQLILSSFQEESPKNLLEEILHDATIVHIGQKDFFRKSTLLRIEEEQFLNKHYTNNEWEQIILDFLLNHEFLTQYAIERYALRRSKNIKKQHGVLLKTKQNRRKKKAGKSFGRGIETLYRATYRNHINLSSIADAKANMMISINTIIMSVIITFAGTGFSISSDIMVERLRFIIPIIILLLASLISVVFAILSARPKVTETSITEQKLKERKSSVLFFGNFTQLPLQKFLEFLNGFKTDQKLLYDNMSIDIYYLGLVLNRKYKLLRISYNTFMAGLIISVFAFVVIFLYTAI